MKFDELNKLFSEYFEFMGLSEEDIRRRIECANRLYEAVLNVLRQMKVDADRREMRDIEFYIQSLAYRMDDIISDLNIPYDDTYIQNYIDQVTSDIIEVTYDHLELKMNELDEEDEDLDEDEDYYVSPQRSVVIAENEANSIVNHSDYVRAKQEGKTRKQWITREDKHVRLWHEEADGEDVPIDEYFLIGDDKMLYPHDYTASPRNIINCRCICIYY